MMKLGKAMNFDIHIEASVNFGYIATMGCAKFVYTDIGELVNAIASYLKDPEGHEKMFFAEFGTAPQPTETDTAERITTGCV